MSLVSKIASLTDLSSQATEWLEEHLREFSFSKGETVLSEGQVCRYLYHVNEGLMYSYYHQNARTSSKEVCNWMAMEDDFATAYYSFISGKQSYETIACLEPTKVSAIHFDRLQELYKMFPETEKAGRLILEEYYLKMESRFYAIRFTSAEQRYRTFAEDRSQLLNRAPLGWIASYLGMTQETLSRIRARRETAL